MNTGRLEPQKPSTGSFLFNLFRRAGLTGTSREFFQRQAFNEQISVILESVIYVITA